MESQSGYGFVTFKPQAVSPAEFVRYWSPRYDDVSNPNVEPLYAQWIGKPFTAESIGGLFAWKENTKSIDKIFKPNRKSVDGIIARISEVLALPMSTSAADFLQRFANISAIYRIFLLHCWQPERFPIYDQHVHRAMILAEEGRYEELGGMPEKRKIEIYVRRYLPFHERFQGCPSRDIDRALWTYGKLLKTWWLPLREGETPVKPKKP